MNRLRAKCATCAGTGYVDSCDYCEHLGICPGPNHSDPDECAGDMDCPDCDGTGVGCGAPQGFRDSIKNALAEETLAEEAERN